ncbi:MAG: hypothetical protein NC332_04005 [Firmicutes bacterium]|nr:hypothetical protein [Bacillota bacterium]
MSKKSTSAPSLTDNTKKIMIIVAICLIAVIIISVALALLLKTDALNPDTENPSTTPSSSLTIKNGDFALTSSDDVGYPKGAVNWTKYGYKDATSFEKIDTDEKVVMGIIDTDGENWSAVTEDLSETSVSVTNPGIHSEELENKNVYMIATRENVSASASIMSDSFSVASTTSVKITVWLNTYQITEGNATIMVQSSSSTPNPKEDNRYAWIYNIEKSSEDKWQAFEIYIFNRKTSSQYIRCDVGLGNVYEADSEAKGVLFIDDIVYETVTANDYRTYVDGDGIDPDATNFKIIEREEEDTTAMTTEYLTIKEYDSATVASPAYSASAEYVTEEKFSPFTTKDDFSNEGFAIYKRVNDGTVHDIVAYEMAPMLVSMANDQSFQDHHHISFWVRTKTNNVLALVNVLVQSRNNDGDEWETLNNGDFTATTEQNIETDTNNGWSKYDIYLKPSQKDMQVRLVISLGELGVFTDSEYAPNGEMFLTSIYHETISNSAYSSASSGTASKKFDLTGATAETTVTNGSFSSAVSSVNDQPLNWTSAFAGENIIYKDGKGNETISGLDKTVSAVNGSGIVRENSSFDDAEGRVLKLVNNKATSYGFVSDNISLSAKTVYVFSVLSKSESADVNAVTHPYFYVIDTARDRENAVIGSVVNIYPSAVNDAWFCQANENVNGWTRYYIVVVTGAEAMSVRIALFNGSIDGTDKPVNTTVYYDKVSMQSMGSYSLVDDTETEEPTEYIVEFNANESFTDFEEVKDIVELKTKLDGASVQIAQPDEDEWKEIRAIPEETDDSDDGDTTATTKTDVDLALLFSILSSVILVAALAVVIVVKVFKRRNNA